MIHDIPWYGDDNNAIAKEAVEIDAGAALLLLYRRVLWIIKFNFKFGFCPLRFLVLLQQKFSL